MENTIYLSKRGIKDLKKEISKLEKKLNHEQGLLRNLESGLSREERFERINKLSKIENLEYEISEMKYQLDHAKPLPRKRDTIKVALGSAVDLIDQKGRLVSYTIVDSLEIDPSKGKISSKSPLGQMLIGKEPNDIVEVGSKMRNIKMQLVNVH